VLFFQSSRIRLQPFYVNLTGKVKMQPDTLPWITHQRKSKNPICKC